MSDGVERARELLRLRRPDAAARAATEHLRLDPDCVEALHVLALAQAARNETPAAIATAESAIRRAPDDARSHYVLASILPDAGRVTDALCACATALELAPDFAAAFWLRARLHLQLGAVKAALAASEAALALDPFDPDHHDAHASALFAGGRHREAEASVLAGLQQLPDDPHLLALRGQLQLRSGDLAAATASCLAALGRDPTLELARQGLLEALRARHRGYRFVLSLRSGLATVFLRVPPALRWPMLIALALCLAGIAGRESVGAVRATLIAALLLPTELANLALFLHPLGRHLLRRWERILAVLVGIGIGAAGACAAAAWMLASPGLLGPAKALAALVLLTALVHWLARHAPEGGFQWSRMLRLLGIVLTMLAVMFAVLCLTTF